MNGDCRRYRELIWREADRSVLPPDALRHVEGCRECARALREAESLVSLVHESSPVPPAPDCRGVVGDRIRGERRATSKWAYAGVFILAAALVIAGVVIRSPDKAVPPRRVVKRVVPEPGRVSLPPAPDKRSSEFVAGPPEADMPTRRVHFEKSMKHKVRPAAESTAIMVKPALYEDDRPTAIAVVTWPGSGDGSDGSYGYVEQDLVAGKTTTCSVERSGDSVSVYLESKPTGGKPEKGEVRYEKSRNGHVACSSCADR